MYHDKSIKELYHTFNTSEKGLTSKQAVALLERYGKNEIEDKSNVSVLEIFLNQFRSSLIWILMLAVVVSFIIGANIDGIVILIILILNAILGFGQEFKAEKAIEALKKMASLQAMVLRDGKEQKIEAADLVPGDIILVNTGDKIPADSRIIESANLEAQEASLTGESNPVVKENILIPKHSQIADMHNMLFSGTIITRGRGKALVIGTGMTTQIGKIAKMIQVEKKAPTPLQVQLKSLSKSLGILVIAICIIVFTAGILKGEPKFEMFLAAIALAVAAIPEGLAAVVTMSLGLGVRRMVRRNVLIRTLPSVETLGCTSVICTDKTGTLTKNEMTVRQLFVNDKVVSVSGSGYSTKGEFSTNSKKFELLLSIGVLCNDAKIEENILGDPTELALIVSASKAKLQKQELDLKYPRISEIPFDSSRKMMTTVHKVKGKKLAFVKGAPDMLVPLCTKIDVNGKVKKLTAKH